ncbi:protein NLRC3-like isoform X4 [Thunnus albacares]|uniref:protein NLRC3-like isoform X4 n=1 Tax=Thunnus albacares TaxID=8236 RepID=UPI001CF63EFA|nr:protein NLRC3-like isoform X4 [Thunnus albacares]XP_044197867.1 protein NLRC3-like isoform X4 [Thunnus albacares]XP_044197868.1 protein NLRC3-like isoform X4 [Thunnus albacares]XP_044197869.1 protein NLRC3-like isoform X4 [Thunnus albacares]XP_044197871.1 protein NLRC3-like isoform X4 [Thunnus albacares]
MAEKRKKRKRSDSTASGQSSFMSEEPISSCSDPSISSQKSTAESTAPSCVSLKSDGSMYQPLNFGREKTQSSQRSTAGSTAPSGLSMKSDGSMYQPLNFGHEKTQSSQMRAADSRAPSGVSMKIDGSMNPPLNLALGETQRQQPGEPSSCSVCKKDLRDLVQFFCGHRSCKKCVSSDWDQSDSTANYPCPVCGKKFRKHQGKTYEDTGKSLIQKAKNAMQKQFASTFEGIGDRENTLKSIYTSLYITTGESAGAHEEHEFRYYKNKLKKQTSCDEVDLSDIFKPFPGQEKPPRTVLTKGVAGIGKSFAVQKFILDWAEEEANKDIDFVFCLAFRELNLIIDEKSLHELLTEFHPALQSLKDSEDFAKGRVIVILDGLDESRLQMDLKNVKTVTSISEVTSVGDLLVNLIQGSLLPNANIWITSRPAAANQIPAKYVDMVTEIRGFNDPQKEEYFGKKFSHDSSLADRITSHIRSSQSLDIMCQIPIFCWISAILFQEVFRGDEKAECPQTLTEMMAHFLFAQTKRRSRKYEKKTEKNKELFLKSQKEFLLKLGKLAFVQLLKNNLIFYEEDFEECGIDIKEAAIYSGFCTAVLREEKVFSRQKVFFFVHLTIQEFFAALYVYDCFTNKNTTELSDFLNLEQKEHTLLDLLKVTVDKVLEEKNGHLDFFLRFLLGLMAEANRKVLQGLLTSPDPSQDTDKKILTYLKAIRRKNLSPDSCINLFQTMVEMRDHKVKDDIQEYLTLSDRLKSELTPLHCSALAYMLQVSKNDVEVLDLKSYNTSDEGRRRLIPAVRSSRKAILADCKVTAEWVKYLAFGLKFPYSPLRDLDLSNNDLKDIGVELLHEGLSSQWCRLKTLRLSGCQITEKGCAFLAKALKSNPSHLIELDLSYNHPGDSGEDQLSELKRDPHYKLNTLNVEHGGSHRMKPGFKKYACELTLDPNTAHKNLRLSEGNRKVTWMEEEQSYRNHSERFDLCPQVLCEQGLDKRCYWEIEVVEPFKIGVTYRTIGRKGDGNDCKLGQNAKSWCMFCSEEGCYVMHNNKSISVASLCSRSSQVGVYLDWPAGTLSFYRVSSDSRTRLHTFKTTFTEPLYPAVEFHTQSSALFCQLT